MGSFETTRWSLVLAAREPATVGRDALEHLCRIYRQPVLAYVRCHCHRKDDAEDLAQAFFLKFIEQRYDADADPARGRFRTFLLTALQRFLSNAYHHATALKRGAHIVQPLDDATIERAATDPAESPEQCFEREWARSVLCQAMRRLQAEAKAAGKGAQFEALRDFMLEPPAAAQYQALSERLQLRRNTIAVTVNRLRARLRELVRMELAETVADQTGLDDEMALLRHAMRRRAPRPA